MVPIIIRRLSTGAGITSLSEHFDINKLSPPLDYENDFFSLVYARSVFTHLSEELQIEWMKEFARIIKKGGYLYFTTHGENTFGNLDKAHKDTLLSKGILTVNTTIEGDKQMRYISDKKVCRTGINKKL